MLQNRPLTLIKKRFSLLSIQHVFNIGVVISSVIFSALIGVVFYHYWQEQYFHEQRQQISALRRSTNNLSYLISEYRHLNRQRIEQQWALQMAKLKQQLDSFSEYGNEIPELKNYSDLYNNIILTSSQLFSSRSDKSVSMGTSRTLMVLTALQDSLLRLEVQSTQREHHQYVLAFFCFITLASLLGATMLVLSIYNYRRVMKPLAALVEGMKRIEQGDLNTPLPIISQDEFKIVLKQFNLMQQQLSRSINSYRNVNKELERFSYSVSHDLRAPLRAISTFAESLSATSGRFDSEAQEALAFILQGADTMRQLIDDILRLSRLERAEICWSDQVDVSAMCHKIIRELLTDSAFSHIKTEVEPNVFVRADHHLLDILLRNLLSNAFKFSQKNPDALVRVYQENETIVIADNGIGFDMKYYDRIFSPFQRLQTRESYDGHGIGLTQCKRVADKHGGDVWAESTPGKGATFFFRLE